MGAALKAFFDWLARLEQAVDYDPVVALEARVRRLEAALAERHSGAEPTQAQ
jgi:hypothetical protein